MGSVLIRGGRVIDPSQEYDGQADVLVTDGAIAQVGPALAADADEVIDASGCLVVPGLIDLHGHWYESSCFGVDPAFNLRGAVATTVDAGSSGYVNFEHFRRTTIETSPVDMLAYLHVAALGLQTTVVGELQDIRFAQPKDAAQMAAKHRDRIVGIKVRLDSWASGTNVNEAFDAALQAAQRAELPLMVHIGPGVDMPRVAALLRPGDVLTHVYTGRGNGQILDSAGRPYPELLDAVERGIGLDTGPGCASFSWEVAQRAFDVGLVPTTISTDLHRYSVETVVVDLPTTMAKFMSLGLSLTDVIDMTTRQPARIVGRSDRIGSLAPGYAGHVSVLELVRGEHVLEDSIGFGRTAHELLTPRWVVVGGTVHRCRDVTPSLRESFASDEFVKCGAASLT